MFRDDLECSAAERQSRLILALDEPDPKKAFAVLRKAAKYLLCVKLHPEMPVIWKTTHEKAIAKIKKHVPFVILDAKLADTPSSNALKSEFYFSKGYDAIICHGFPGRDSVNAIQSAATQTPSTQGQPRGVFLLCGMTSPGHLFTEETALKLAAMGQALNVDGLIAPGNQYDLLSKIHAAAPNLPIASPGIGKQGGDAKSAAQNGTRYAIVGRSILQAEKPGIEARRTRDAVQEVFS